MLPRSRERKWRWGWTNWLVLSVYSYHSVSHPKCQHWCAFADVANLEIRHDGLTTQESPTWNRRRNLPFWKEGAATVSATTGFCSRPLKSQFTRSGGFRATSWRRPDKCPLDDGKRKCPRQLGALCIRGGSNCFRSNRCCSRHCVLCVGRCMGRCGLDQGTKRDRIYAFYYPWYATPSVDRRWFHWNASRRIGGGAYDPDSDDLPSPLYPVLGAYSSSNTSVINQHMAWMRQAGIGVVILSWWGQGSFEDNRVWDLLDAADDYGLRVSFYVEPYRRGYKSERNANGTRSPFTARDDVKYIMDLYGCHRALHRIDGRPVFFFFAAREYMAGSQENWKLVWDEVHLNARYNPIVIAHDINLRSRISPGGWDGGHAYGIQEALSQNANWKNLAKQYLEAKKLFFFTVSPGYDKTRMSPGTDPIVSRRNGKLYRDMWKKAIRSRLTSSRVLITSFNEWHEGTSIEPVVPMSISNYTYRDYEGHFGMTGMNASMSYVAMTRAFSNRFLTTVK